MKKNYVPTTLDQFLNESKTITLKRGYGQKQPVVVGANAPLRNQVLAFVSEGVKVTRSELKRFIAGLNEGSKNPVAAANMWLQRNEKFFVTESKNGETFYKLSSIGKRLANRFVSSSNSNEISESLRSIRNRIDMNKPLNEALRPLTPEEEDFIENSDEVPEKIEDKDDPFVNLYKFKDGKIIVVLPDGTKRVKDELGGEEPHNGPFNESADDEDFEPGTYDFIDRRKGYPRPGIYDMDENDESCEGEECCVPGEEDDENLDESTKSRIKRILENIKAKDRKALNEAEEDDDEKKSDEEDELTFDDLELGDEEETEEDEEKVDAEEVEEEKEEGDDEDVDDEEGEEGEEKVEITEFIITVDNVEEALEELEELGVTGEQVLDEEGEPIEDQIKVSADDWDALKGWLEEKGVDIEEMFGGEIETEDEEGTEGSEEEVEGEEFKEEGEELEGEELELEDEEPEPEGEGKIDLGLK